jgi:hypothetical protein
MFTCLGCDIPFSTRKRLSAHTAVCPQNHALSNALYAHKRKTADAAPIHKAKKSHHHSPERISPPADSSIVPGPSVPVQDDPYHEDSPVDYPEVSVELYSGRTDLILPK